MRGHGGGEAAQTGAVRRVRRFVVMNGRGASSTSTPADHLLLRARRATPTKPVGFGFYYMRTVPAEAEAARNSPSRRRSSAGARPWWELCLTLKRARTTSRPRDVALGLLAFCDLVHFTTPSTWGARRRRRRSPSRRAPPAPPRHSSARQRRDPGVADAEEFVEREVAAIGAAAGAHGRRRRRSLLRRRALHCAGRRGALGRRRASSRAAARRRTGGRTWC